MGLTATAEAIQGESDRERNEKIVRPAGRRIARLKASSIHIIEGLMLAEICKAGKEHYSCHMRQHACYAGRE
jgi:hypothetical protein